MVAEVRIEHWCDRHLADGAGKVEALPHVLDVGAGRREVDLCAECVAGLLAPLSAVLDAVSRPADEHSTTRGKPTTAPVAQQQAPGVGGDAAIVCPVCEARCASQSAFTSHAGRHHGSSTAVYGHRCPLCGVEGGINGGGRHLSTHGVPSVREAFLLAEAQGDPYGVVAARRHVWADMRRNAA